MDPKETTPPRIRTSVNPFDWKYAELYEALIDTYLATSQPYVQHFPTSGKAISFKSNFYIWRKQILRISEDQSHPLHLRAKELSTKLEGLKMSVDKDNATITLSRPEAAIFPDAIEYLLTNGMGSRLLNFDIPVEEIITTYQNLRATNSCPPDEQIEALIPQD